MKRATIAKRVERLEARLLPSKDNGRTLEEVCRNIWDSDPARFRELAAWNSLGYFVRAFEGEQAEADRGRTGE